MKKIIGIMLAMLMLTGCTLAKPGKSGQDKLTGFFVTVSYKDGDTMVDAWDEEAAGMDFISNHYLEGTKLYAERTGEDPVVYEFPEGCGLSCFGYDVQEEGMEPYRSETISPEFDALLEYHAGSEMPYRLNATIYGTEDTNAVIQMNPVYQTPDGEVYVLSDKPMSYDVATMDGCSASISQTGEDGCTATLTIRHVVLPETYTTGADAAYLILEARAGKNTTRTVYSPGDESPAMDPYRPGQYGLCIKGYTTIFWEGAK